MIYCAFFITISCSFSSSLFHCFIIPSDQYPHNDQDLLLLNYNCGGIGNIGKGNGYVESTPY